MSQEEREVYATVHAAQVRQRQLGKSEQPQADGCQQIKLYHSVLGAGEPESPIDPGIFAQVLESTTHPLGLAQYRMGACQNKGRC